MSNEDRPYRPSNGTEGMGFIETYCANCIHEKFMHTQNHDDLTCDILSRSFAFDPKDKEYPTEWIWRDNRPICTAYKHWDWGFDDGEGNGFNEPPPPEPYNPNQLVMPFLLDEMEFNKKRELVI